MGSTVPVTEGFVLFQEQLYSSGSWIKWHTDGGESLQSEEVRF